MKRKLLSVLLTFCLAFSLLPTAALADGEGTPQTEGGEKTNYVAQIGSTGYATLQEAVNAAKDGDTITLLGDAELTETLNITKAITLDGANHKITGKPSTGETSFITVITDGSFTMANATILPTSKVEKNSAIDLQVKGKVVVDNCVFGAADDANQFMYNGLEFSQSRDYPMADGTTISNCTFYGGSFRHNFISFYRMAEGATININGNKFLNVNWDTTNAIRVSNYSNVNATINLLDDTYNDHGTDENKDYAGLLIFQETSDNNDKFTTLTVNIKNLDTTGAQSNQLFYVYKDGAGIISINQPVVKGDSSIEKFFVAKVGDTSYYKTLADAVKAADNATVTLLKDVTERVSISKNLVLDLNGKTLTGENLVNSNGKNERIALTANAGEVKVKNGIIDGRVNAYDRANLTIDADVTVKNSYNGSGYDCFGIVVWGDGIFGQDGCKTPSLTVNGKVIMEKGGVAISTNGNDKSCAIVTINNGAVISTTEDGAIYLPSGKLTMNGGTVSGPTGIQICAGSTNITSEFKLHNGTVIATGADERTSKGTGDGLIPDGAAISVVNRNYPNGVPSVTIDGGSFSSANSDAVLAYSWSNGAASEWTDAKTYVKINDGYFTSDPTAYLAASHYVWASDKDGYAYMVKDNAPTSPEQKITVIDKTDATVSDTIKPEDKTKIEEVKDKANVDGVAEAVTPAKKADIVSKSNANPGDNDKVEIEVAVKVVAKTADLAKGQLTFEASPVATVKVNGAATGTTVPVTNDMLNGQPITVKLPLPTVDGKLFTPEQIKHISSDGSVEYFLKTAKRGAKTFEIKDDCAVFKITKFSTFELSGTVTYVEPSYSSGSSYDPTYSVTVDKTKNGTVTVSPKSASKGDRVTVTVKPDSGYVLETLTVTDKNGNELTLKDKGDGKYTFTMPAGKVEVKATFMEDNSMLNFFYDVPNNAYFYEAVKWAVENGITTGVGNDLFAPEQPCTRAQIVTFLWRAAGSPEPKGAASGMTDVVSGSYYEKAVAWAIENGITTGTTTSTFSPDATCTRAQAVTFLARALKAKAASAAEFSDVPTGSYFADAVAWAAANGVTEGIGGGLFGSDNDCTRGQIVTFLYRAYNK